VRTISAIDDVRFCTDDSTLDLMRKIYSELPTEHL
jgi:hypothetical protein